MNSDMGLMVSLVLTLALELDSSAVGNYSDRKSGQPQEQQQRDTVVDLIIEMQRRTEEEAGLHHFLEDEEKVKGIFEDDIKLTAEQAKLMLSQESQRKRRRKRKLATSLELRWSLPIPYMFDGTHNDEEKKIIKEALSYWEELTCLRFAEVHTTEDKLLFTKAKGCWSYVGYTKQVNQTVSVGPGCQSNGTIAHELGHAIGFWHEQSRPDRDDHVLINTTNVTRGKLYNFKKRTWGEILTLDVPYDLASAMHYGSKFYAKNENTSDSTVQTRDALMSRVIGQRQELSFYDVKLANGAYCRGSCISPLPKPCEREGYQDPNACHRCRCPDGFSGTFCQSVAPAVNAFCGGPLDAHVNGTIYSPGYLLSGYQPDTQCSWLIQGLPGSHVYLQFIGDFSVSGHIDICKDFVEVRYNTSLALTGARLCCSDPPRHPIRSDTHEMLLLLRTFKESRVCDDTAHPWKCHIGFTGFKAKYYMSSCGGCHGDQTIQPACKRRVSYTCQQTWQQTVNVLCDWWDLGCQPQTRLVPKLRYATCYRDTGYCCNRYTLQRDGTTCTADTNVPRRTVASTRKVVSHSRDRGVQRDRANPPNLGPSNFARASNVARQPLVSWSRWSAWSTCPVTCGGSHAIRTRVCLYPHLCGSAREQTDTKPCATIPCYSTCVHTKSVLCGIFRRTCARRVVERCNPKCNSGFTLQNNVCQ